MIVVLKPSGSYGHSFKGLSQYCAADEDRQGAERVEWTETRNLATDDPTQAWKLMHNTAKAQNELKQANGIQRGQPPKAGPVLHIVMSFHEDEPQSRQEMAAAADQLLARLGADPSKASKAKKTPKRRQFADEHQVVMYCHNDGTTDENGHIVRGKHLHLMVNRINPQTGVLLPDKNDRDKAQSWALKYSKKHNTADHTPARQLNHDERRTLNSDGERTWVKHPNRQHKDAYELEKTLKDCAANDDARITNLKEQHRKADHDLAERKRQHSAQELKEVVALLQTDTKRQNVIDLAERREIKRIQQQIRDKYRPLEAALKSKHAKGLDTANTVETLFDRLGKGLKNTFGISTNEGERLRKQQAAQEAERKALANRRASEEQAAVEAVRRSQAIKLDANRFRSRQDMARLGAQHAEKRNALRAKQAEINTQRSSNALEIKKIAFQLKALAVAKLVARQTAERIKPVFRRFAGIWQRQQSSSGDDRTQPKRQAANDQPQTIPKPPAPPKVSEKKAPAKVTPPRAPEQSKLRSAKVDAFKAQQRGKRGSEAFKQAMRRPAREQDNQRDDRER